MGPHTRACRMAASSSRAPPRGASAQGPAGKVGAGASGSGKGAGSGKAGSKAAGGGKGGAGSAAAPAPPPSAEELARRREMMAAAAEARAKALQQATQAQKLWCVLYAVLDSIFTPLHAAATAAHLPTCPLAG